MKYDPIDPRLFTENRARLAARLKPDAFAVFHSADIPWLCADGYCGCFRTATFSI